MIRQPGNIYQAICEIYVLKCLYLDVIIKYIDSFLVKAILLRTYSKKKNKYKQQKHYTARIITIQRL